MKRNFLLLSIIFSQLFFTQTFAATSYFNTILCKVSFGSTGCGQTLDDNTNTNTYTPTSFSFFNFFDSWKNSWASDNFQPVNTQAPAAQNGGDYFPSTVEVNTGSGVKATDFGVGTAVTSGSVSPILLSQSEIENKKNTLQAVIEQCSKSVSPDCVLKVTQQNTALNNSTAPTKYDKNDESVDPDHSSSASGPQIIYSDKQSQETPYLIPGTNQYASQPFSQYSQNVTGPSVYTGSPIDMKSICKTATGQGQLLNPNGVNISQVNKKLLGDAQAASAAVGKPLTVVSGWRSQTQQDVICRSGGTGAKACGPGGSMHTQKLALDVQFRGYSDAEKVKAILVFLAGGWSIGNYANDGHTHVGLDGGELTWRWFGVYPQLYKQTAFTRASINWAASKTAPRAQVAEGAKKALQVLCQ
jgi:hypothetical protein